MSKVEKLEIHEGEVVAKVVRYLVLHGHATNQKDLAKKMGTSEATVTNNQKPAKVPGGFIRKLEKLLEPLNMRFEDFIAAGTEEGPEDPIKLIYTQQMHNNAKLDILMQMIESLQGEVASLKAKLR